MNIKSIIVGAIASLFIGTGCQAEDAPKPVTVAPAKVLVAYYSWGGNTRLAASEIQKATGGTLFEIKPVKPYPADYQTCVKQAKEDIKAGLKPELATKVDDLSKYDVIFIGTPNWWSTIATPVTTFLSSYDFKGKTVIPFVTHGGGGLAGCEKAVRALCPTATVMPAGVWPGESVRQSRDKIRAWVAQSVTLSK